MISFPIYLDILGEFLDRPLSHLEFAFNYEKVREEVMSAIKRKEAGIIESGEQIEQGRKDYANRLDSILKNKLKGRVMEINLSQGTERNDNGIDISGYDGWVKPE